MMKTFPLAVLLLVTIVEDAWSRTPLNIYEQTELDLIWSDRGSGADHGCSIWRAKKRAGYYPVGDFVVRTHHKPRMGFLVRMSNPQSGDLRQPTGYSGIWNDKGSGADMSVTIWRPKCPHGYKALGDVATSGHYPKGGEIYCFRQHFTVYTAANNWVWTWNDEGSGSNTDATFFTAVTHGNHALQGTNGMGVIASNKGVPHPFPHILKKSYTTYHAEKPIKSLRMGNIRFDKTNHVSQKPWQLMSSHTINYSSMRQKVRRTIVVKESKTSSYEFSNPFPIGISLEVSRQNYEPAIEFYTTGQEKTTTKDVPVTYHVTFLRGFLKTTATMIGNQFKAINPFVATVTKVYFDGTEAKQQMTGIYKIVEINSGDPHSFRFGPTIPI